MCARIRALLIVGLMLAPGLAPPAASPVAGDDDFSLRAEPRTRK
jgi:hypothetical protein